MQLVDRTRNKEGVAVADHVLRAGVERRLHDGILRRASGIYGYLRLAVEHPGDGVGGAEVSAVTLEDVADLRDGPVGVVGGRLDEDGRAPRAVPLVGDLFVRHALELTGPLLHCALDV